MYSNELIKGTLRTIILSLLSNSAQMYGYEITKHVKEQTEGKIQLTEGALYPTLHKLEADGLLQTEVVSIGKRQRKYYRLTPLGAKEAHVRIAEFSDFAETMRRLLGSIPPKTHIQWQP
jgi:DNA-binding PadR family transcriptional regulator